MADKDQEPSLELPSFGRRRKARKERREHIAAPDHTATDETVVQPSVPDPVAPELAETRVQPVAAPEPELAPEPAPQPPKEKRERRLPAVGGYPSALITGALVGLVGVGLTTASFRLCEVVQGTSSCGKPGFLLLIVILVVMVWLGRILLKLWGSPDPGSSSFLAVGLLTVLALLFLVDSLFEWWMVIVIPVLGMATYALSYWVTTAFIEPAE